MRVPAEDIKQVRSSINGREYVANRGWFDMPDHDARVHLKAANMPTPNLGGVVTLHAGFRCGGCGFASHFVTCSRCGGICEREV